MPAFLILFPTLFFVLFLVFFFGSLIVKVSLNVKERPKYKQELATLFIKLFIHFRHVFLVVSFFNDKFYHPYTDS